MEWWRRATSCSDVEEWSSGAVESYYKSVWYGAIELRSSRSPEARYRCSDVEIQRYAALEARYRRCDVEVWRSGRSMSVQRCRSGRYNALEALCGNADVEVWRHGGKDIWSHAVSV